MAVEILGYCPWCDEVLVDAPVCSKHGDVAGLEAIWYECGNIYPMEECIRDLFNEMVLYYGISNRLHEKHKDIIDKCFKDFRDK